MHAYIHGLDQYEYTCACVCVCVCVRVCVSVYVCLRVCELRLRAPVRPCPAESQKSPCRTRHTRPPPLPAPRSAGMQDAMSASRHASRAAARSSTQQHMTARRATQLGCARRQKGMRTDVGSHAPTVVDARGAPSLAAAVARAVPIAQARTHTRTHTNTHTRRSEPA